MKSNWQLAKEVFLQHEYTCVVRKDDMQYTSQARGVKPLMDWIAEGIDLKGFSAADKVVGKATAFLYVLLGVKEVYAPVMSEGAVWVFREYGVTMEAGEIVSAIRNRSNTGFCPMETAVAQCTTPGDAYEVILKKQKELK